MDATSPHRHNPHQKHEKIKLVEINSYLTCYLCKGYLIDATTISECLHSFCRSCVIKFLQENCYCPVCEVIINKAKPCLKLDKTLQDIVYKLVPELFVKEMYRRKEFYQRRPSLAPKVTPEERGEDTERTIFNPQDAISLSLEYVSDDSAPGAIPALSIQKNATSMDDLQQDNPMKRYLQCPGMCRIEVLKKFVRNKYNVDTNLFHIDILYKRVPLPDHYTLIDIGYIYSWKRNEPMKFFFRITDINKVSERFDYFDGRISPEIPAMTHPAKPVKVRQSERNNNNNNNNETITEKDTPHKNNNSRKNKDDNNIIRKKVTVKNNKERTPPPRLADSKKQQLTPKKVEDPPMKKAEELRIVPLTPKKDEDPPTKKREELRIVETKKDEKAAPQPKPPEITEEMKSKIQSDVKNSVYTNITLNRDENVEIITKIHKVSNKEGHPIGLNIVNHTVKKTSREQVMKNNKTGSEVVKNKFVMRKVEEEEAKPPTPPPLPSPPPPLPPLPDSSDEVQKSIFLKSIELTARKPELGSAQKRKLCSPVKKDNAKGAAPASSKDLKKPLKIIIQPKSTIHQNPTVRQMVTNVNQNANDMSKIVETSTKSPDLKSLIDNCKLNIPSSLSIITLNEGGSGGGGRTPPSIAPVKNYIEILKLPGDGKNDAPDKKQTFQKIFEESIVKKGGGGSSNENKTAAALDLSGGEAAGGGGKRKMLDIAASQLNKRKKAAARFIPPVRIITKESGKIAIPRLDFRARSAPQTSAAMRSSSLGLNYTVSVGQAAKAHEHQAAAKNAQAQSQLSSSQLLEKYNIQNLAQLSASLHLGGGYGGVLHQAMLMKQLEQHQSWLSQQAPILQYEKYLQSLKGQRKLTAPGNVKEN